MSDPKKGLLPVFLTVFIDLLGFGIVIPLLPIYAQNFGSSAATARYPWSYSQRFRWKLRW